MKVVSRLAKMDFTVGSIERDGDNIVIKSHPDQAMKAKVTMTPDDVMSMLKASLNWPVISFAFSFPFLYVKAKRANNEGDSN